MLHLCLKCNQETDIYMEEGGVFSLCCDFPCEKKLIVEAIEKDARVQKIIFPVVRKLRPILKSVNDLEKLEMLLSIPEPDEEKTNLQTCPLCLFHRDGPVLGSRRARHICPIDPHTKVPFICKDWRTCPSGWRSGHLKEVDQKPQTIETLEKKIKKIRLENAKKEDAEKKKAKQENNVLKGPPKLRQTLEEICSKKQPPYIFEDYMN